ncbi:hypothetical protein Lal_00043884 [Lupinus albus]|uniref:Uncharacterized protein n=1 Tax=Lupinus albus TaxID=3870 RepID=A0A6A5PEH0_LUPAL|nr:hypothetical protein Lalb_Chr15g0090031 [Lupinus albus]KAF1895239.1 hypothetical protein Lal_00043884 [Lupinus albus]
MSIKTKESEIMGGGRRIRRRRRLYGSYSERPIPKRGQVKVGIVVGLANSLAFIFSRTTACVPLPPSH